MIYDVVFSEGAAKDLREITGYVAMNLANPTSAFRIRDDILVRSHSLARFPKAAPARYTINGKRIRIIHSHKYAIIYSVNDSVHRVVIEAVIYARMDIPRQLDGRI